MEQIITRDDVFCGGGAMSLEKFKISITEMRLKIAHLTLHPHLGGHRLNLSYSTIKRAAKS